MAYRKDLVQILKNLIGKEIDLPDDNEVLNAIVGINSDLDPDMSTSITVTVKSPAHGIVGTSQVGFCEAG